MEWKRIEPKARPAAAAPAKGKILYVEDEDPNWELMVLALRDKYDLTRARDPKEAFAALAKTRFSLILMDIQLGGSELNGIDVTQILKNKYRGDAPSYSTGIRCPQTPIVFVTAYTARYSKAVLIRVGGDDMLTKPLDLGLLSATLARLLPPVSVTMGG
ncbi:MAG: response regulator [Deltaproteobacteria bacterium]|nr:response regulator [Deltaproteobacteria bacterium]